MRTISNSTSSDANDTTQLNGNESLLIVDDEKAMVDLAYDLLSNHSYQASLEKTFDREKIKGVFKKVLS